MARTRGMRARPRASMIVTGFAIGAMLIGGGTAVADASRAAPVVSEHDDVGAMTRTVRDRVDGLADAATRDVLVRNAPPRVAALAVGVAEGGVGRIRAVVTARGADRLSARIEWGDGTPAEPVTIEQLAAGVDHGYGDDGDYPVTVTVTDDDDDGGVGAHAVAMRITNIPPHVELDLAATAVLPGGRFAVLAAGEALVASVRATDAGSDDLVLTWSNGLGRTFLRDGTGPDAPLSPSGATPVSAAARTEQRFAEPGVEMFRVVLADDDGGVADASADVLVTGTDGGVRSRSRWIGEFTGTAPGGMAPATAGAYLDVVEAASAVFSEAQPLTAAAEAVAVLSARADDPRTQVRAELLCAWLQFASGAVRWDARVPTSSGADVAFGELVAGAEAAVAEPATSDDVLREIREDLSRVSIPQD